MKIVRNKVETYFKARIDDLYTPEGKKLDSAKNIESLKKLLG
jgi:long-chain acyl-CoA synthetase